MTHTDLIADLRAMQLPGAESAVTVLCARAADALAEQADETRRLTGDHAELIADCLTCAADDDDLAPQQTVRQVTLRKAVAAITAQAAEIARLEHVLQRQQIAYNAERALDEAEIARLTDENFALAAGQCANATADDGGTPYCKEIAALRAERDELDAAVGMAEHWQTLAEKERDAAVKWRLAIDEAMVVAHIGVADEASDPHDCLNRLLEWHHDIWLDPAVCSEAQALVDKGKSEGQAERDAAVAALRQLHACLRWHYDRGNFNEMTGVRLKIDKSALRMGLAVIAARQPAQERKT
jgi:hypothetical protein